MSTTSSNNGGYQLYRYEPSLVAAVIFTIIFALLGIAHIFRVVKGKIFYFFVFTIGIWRTTALFMSILSEED